MCPCKVIFDKGKSRIILSKKSAFSWGQVCKKVDFFFFLKGGGGGGGGKEGKN